MTAERELALLEGRCETLRALEADKDRLLKAYTSLAPEALDSLGSEERRTVYSMLGLVVEALPDEGLKVSGAFGEETPVWENVRTSRRSSTEANPPARKTFGFVLSLREAGLPETSLRILGNS